MGTRKGERTTAVRVFPCTCACACVRARACVRSAQCAVHVLPEARAVERTICLRLSRREPLQFLLGAGHILKGMETALKGSCEGDQISATIPPHLAFEDPTKSFKQKIVPDGSTVIYHMTVASIRKGHGVASLPRSSRPPPPPPGWLEMAQQNMSAVLFGALAVALLLLCQGGSTSKASKARKPKKKKTG